MIISLIESFLVIGVKKHCKIRMLVDVDELVRIRAEQRRTSLSRSVGTRQ